MTLKKLYVINIDHECALPEDDAGCCHFVYADGKLEHMVGYDIVYYSKKDGFNFDTERIEDVEAVLPDGKTVKARLFFWRRYHDPAYGRPFCGYLVDVTDKERLENAQQAFDERRRFI